MSLFFFVLSASEIPPFFLLSAHLLVLLFWSAFLSFLCPYLNHGALHPVSSVFYIFFIFTFSLTPPPLFFFDLCYCFVYILFLPPLSPVFLHFSLSTTKVRFLLFCTQYIMKKGLKEAHLQENDCQVRESDVNCS